MEKNKGVRYARIGLYIIGLIIFLEVSSTIVLNHVIDPVRIERFDILFLKDLKYHSNRILPHPYLGWVTPQYLDEQERYLSHLGKEKGDYIYIATLGGSTTETGYPKYTQDYLNQKLEGANSPLRAEVFNFGVGGWNSQNSLLNYAYLVRYLHPDFIILHHNVNDYFFDMERLKQSIVYLPTASRTEKALLQNSRFYKLLRFTVLLSYNHVSYGTGTVLSEDANLPIPSRISSLLNEEDGSVQAKEFFRIDFAGSHQESADAPAIVPTPIHLLSETYECFIRYTTADHSTLIMTTQYQNFSKKDGGGWPLPEDEKSFTQQINSLIKSLSASNNVPLVDLDAEMEQYDYLLLDDCVHFVEEGIKIKGELVGEGIWELIQAEHKDD